MRRAESKTRPTLVLRSSYNSSFSMLRILARRCRRFRRAKSFAAFRREPSVACRRARARGLAGLDIIAVDVNTVSPPHDVQHMTERATKATARMMEFGFFVLGRARGGVRHDDGRRRCGEWPLVDARSSDTITASLLARAA